MEPIYHQTSFNLLKLYTTTFPFPLTPKSSHLSTLLHEWYTNVSNDYIGTTEGNEWMVHQIVQELWVDDDFDAEAFVLTCEELDINIEIFTQEVILLKNSLENDEPKKMSKLEKALELARKYKSHSCRELIMLIEKDEVTDIELQRVNYLVNKIINIKW